MSFSSLVRWVNRNDYALVDFGPRWDRVLWIKIRMPNHQLVRYSWERPTL